MPTSYKLNRKCSRCDATIIDQSRLGICRRCHCLSFKGHPKQRTPETEARRIAALVEANRRRVYLPWLPPEHREEYRAQYRSMVSNRKFKAEEARQIILADIRAKTAKLSPFERQERALARGARLVANDIKPSLANPGVYRAEDAA
jgi:hypothetical protein